MFRMPTPYGVNKETKQGKQAQPTKGRHLDLDCRTEVTKWSYRGVGSKELKRRRESIGICCFAVGIMMYHILKRYEIVFPKY